MKKSEIYEFMKKVGDLSTILGIRDVTVNDGRARGVRAFDLKNGAGLTATVFADRGLDIPYLTYKGYNIGFLSKSGVSSPFSYQYTKDGLDSFLRQFYAGFLTTCGITYSGAPCEDEGREFALHGPASNTVAENVSARMEVCNDEMVLKVSGSVREARLFAENVRLSRELVMHTEDNIIEMKDTVENLGYTRQPVMMIYHVNFGFPFLDADARVYLSAREIEAQTPFAQQGLDKYNIIEEPEDVREEQVYYHTGESDPENSFAMLYNARLGIAAVVHFNALQFPILSQWKSMQSGDYALGLEPTNCGTHGRKDTRESGMLQYLDPGQSCAFDLRFEFTDDMKVIDSYRARAKEE